MRFKSIVETAANAVLVVACCVFIWAVAAHRVSQSRDPVRKLEQAAIGRLIEPVGGAWSGRGKTLVIAIRKDCHFCEASLPFYLSLFRAQQDGKLSSTLLFVLPDEAGEGKRFMQDSGLSTESILGIPLARIGVNVTPTLLLVNSSGQVEKAWVGQLNNAQQASVIESIKR